MTVRGRTAAITWAGGRARASVADLVSPVETCSLACRILARCYPVVHAMLKDELSTDMDRLTQLQDAIEALITISTSSLHYLTTKTAFKRLNSDVPVTFRNPNAETEAVFEEQKKELVHDLTVKAKQVEYLIRALPDKEDSGPQDLRLEGLQREIKVANEEYVEAVKVAEALLADINATVQALLQGAGAPSAGEQSSHTDGAGEGDRGLEDVGPGAGHG